MKGGGTTVISNHDRQPLLDRLLHRRHIPFLVTVEGLGFRVCGLGFRV
jgi:uncharacterized protein (DUF2249 family)